MAAVPEAGVAQAPSDFEMLNAWLRLLLLHSVRSALV